LLFAEEGRVAVGRMRSNNVFVEGDEDVMNTISGSEREAVEAGEV